MCSAISPLGILTNPGLAAILLRACFIAAPVISPVCEFQLHSLVIPSGLIERLSPVLPKNV